ncbi:MAG: protein-methionine-sulfoxide reductase heme-binding subunit MsrQ [Pelolinea sp.]|nr:protein-methionine-sulfoxide reductase heme-binding subunit MsrQ [Pelolinea sp.]
MKISRVQLIAGVICLIPLGLLGVNYWRNDLTANPIQAATMRTGRTAINLLILSLACTQIWNIFGLTIFLKIRKTLGLFSFLYAALHFLIFAGLDFEFNLSWIINELRYKPFIQIGLSALVLLIPLVITSINIIQRKMGKWWKILHRMVYLVAILAIIHYLMATKGDILRPIIYAAMTLVLLLLRIPSFSRTKLAQKYGWLKSINSFLLH